LDPDTHSGFAIWLTGLPASGKSAVTAELTRRLRRAGLRVAVLESDAMRQQFPTSTYEAKDREYFYTALAFIGCVLVQNGTTVLFDATANRRSFRDRARHQIEKFLEIYVDTPLEVCTHRDPKGIYRKGRTGELHEVPGLQVEYEPPLHPDLVIHGEIEDPATSANRIVELLRARKFLAESV